jgi:hypothetical protein
MFSFDGNEEICKFEDNQKHIKIHEVDVLRVC